jgi:mono/diheme cytochrome c family protein
MTMREKRNRSAATVHLLPWLALLLVVAAVTACGPARRGEPFASPRLAENERTGQEHFMHHCHECHPGGDAGLGPALNNKPLPRWLMKRQVRHGLGAMPGFSEQEISDGDLGLILDYLKALRRQGGLRRPAGFDCRYGSGAAVRSRS